MKACFSPGKWCNDELCEDNRKTVCEAQGRKRKVVGKPLSLGGVPVSPQHTGHRPPNPLGHPELSPAPVTAAAPPQRREMHAGKKRQGNRQLSKSQEG